MKDDNLNQVTKRTAGYWYVDGLAEIGTGFVFLVLGVFYLVLAGFEPGGVSSLIVGIGQPAIILLGVYGVSRVVRYFKERITFPRTGYVSYRRKPQNVRRRKVMLSGSNHSCGVGGGDHPGVSRFAAYQNLVGSRCFGSVGTRVFWIPFGPASILFDRNFDGRLEYRAQYSTRTARDDLCCAVLQRFWGGCNNIGDFYPAALPAHHPTSERGTG